jgi:hypothetical protein
MFTGHNIRLDDGTLTKPDMPLEMSAYGEFKAARAFPEGLQGKSIVALPPRPPARIHQDDIGLLPKNYDPAYALYL